MMNELNAVVHKSFIKLQWINLKAVVRGSII